MKILSDIKPVRGAKSLGTAALHDRESGAGWTSGYVGPPLIFYSSRCILLPIDTEVTSSGKPFNQKVSWRLHEVRELHVMFSHFKQKK